MILLFFTIISKFLSLFFIEVFKALTSSAKSYFLNGISILFVSLIGLSLLSITKIE